MKTIDTISRAVRRRFVLGKQGLWPGRRWVGKDGAAKALRTAEAVQLDPVSVIAQSHNIVLWGRVTQYQSDQLDSLLYKERKFFDYGGALYICPIEELPYWRVMMERRKSDQRWADFAQANPALLAHVQQEIRARGPLRNRDLEGQAVDHYRSGKDTGVALYYLWITGKLMNYSRHGKERVYDFMENVAPAHLQWSATENEAIEYFIRKGISQLGFVNERDFRRIVRSATERPVSVKEAKLKLAELLAAGRVEHFHLESHQEPLYCLASDAPLLNDLADGQTPPAWHPLQTTTKEDVIFLSPLEYVSARGRAKELFDFDYIWEIYKPASKRNYGPYTLPILYGDKLVARMDSKLDRQSQTLLINGFWLEEWFAPDRNFALAFAKGLLSFAGFLDANRLDTRALNPTFLRRKVDEYLLSNDITNINTP